MACWASDSIKSSSEYSPSHISHVCWPPWRTFLIWCFHGHLLCWCHWFQFHGSSMVIPPPVRPARVLKYLKPYVLRMHFTNKFVSAQVVHTPTATVASSASSQEKLLRPSMDSTRDVAAAAKIGKILGERLLMHGIPAISIFLKREQKYHGKVKAIVDSVRDAGVKLL